MASSHLSAPSIAVRPGHQRFAENWQAAHPARPEDDILRILVLRNCFGCWTGGGLVDVRVWVCAWHVVRFFYLLGNKGNLEEFAPTQK